MLDLDDPRWNQLRCDRISRPDKFLPLLARLRDDPAPTDRAFDPLVPHLWQQFDVEETTVAAFPYLVTALARIPPERRAWSLEQVGLVAALVSERQELSPPEDVLRAYRRSVGDALVLALEALGSDLEADDVLPVLAAVAALKGQAGACNALLGLSRASGECPECGEEIDLWDVCRHW